MSPQATAGPTTAAQRQIERARRLEGVKADLLAEISANRTYLRLMDKNGELDGENTTVDGKQVSAQEWLDDFYAEKEKDQQRSDDDIKRTKRVKDEARKQYATGKGVLDRL